jgi:hypothetical protein
MKRILLAVMLLSLVQSCKDLGSEATDLLTELPEVVATQTNYLSSDIRASVPHVSLLQRFSQAYNGKYSDNLKVALLNYVDQRAVALGLSTTELTRCVQATGQRDPSAIALPYRVEKAKYDSTDCWLIEFVCSHSSPDDLRHYRCFILDAVTSGTLLYITCR